MKYIHTHVCVNLTIIKTKKFKYDFSNGVILTGISYFYLHNLLNIFKVEINYKERKRDSEVKEGKEKERCKVFH